MGARGPQPTQINWDEFDKLASYQCTQEEIAGFFGVSLDTLERACLAQRGVKLAELWSKRQFTGRVKLRKLQFQIIERMGPGASTMAIYLDKKMFPNENPDRPQPTDVEKPVEKSAPKIKSFTEFCIDAGYFEPFEKQLEMKSFAIDEESIRLLLGSRGYGKTDYCTIGGVAYDLYVAYMQGNDMSYHTNLIITKSKSRNAAIIEEISNALEKNGVPLDKSNSTTIRVQGLIGQDHSVEAITIKTSMRGRHPKRIVMDDPVTDEDVSEAMRLLVKRKYEEATKLCQNIIIIGQPAHAYDLYAELRGIVKTLEVPHGSIPQLDADLDAQRLAGVSEASIQASYHLNILTDGSSIFSNIKYLEKYPNGDSVAFIDPSDGGDYTAVSIIRGQMDGVAVQGHVWKKAWYHCLEDMVPIFKARGVKRLCFETNMTGTHPLVQLRQIFGPHGIGVVGKHSDTNKHAIIQSAGSYAHMIHLSKESDKTYTDHVVKYEYGAKFDDAPDSLARGLEWLGLLKGKK